MPKVTVLLPVYNAEKHIKSSIQSVLNQIFIDFELLIVDDGSTDKSIDVIKTFNDSRIRLIQNSTNLGLIKTLNKGIDLAKGKYIARMDADDISHPQRLEKQFNFLEQNPHSALVGTQANFIFDDKPSNTLFKVEANSKILPLLSLFTCPFIHPSVMIRTEILRDFYYNEGFIAAEDYELWTRILKKYPCANLPKSLLRYRVHDNNISTTQNDKQIDSVRRIYQANLEYIQMPYTEADLDIYLKISGSYHEKITLSDLKNIESWLNKMQSFLLKEGKYQEEIIREVIKVVWFQVCSKVRYNGIKVFFIYVFQRNFKKSKLKDIFKLLVQCLSSYSVFKKIYQKAIYIYRYH